MTKLTSILLILLLTSCSVKYSDNLADKGYAKESSDDNKKAMKIYNRAIWLNKKSALAYWRRGNLYASETFDKNYSKALSDLNASIEIDSTYNGGYAFWDRAYIKREINDTIGALSDYNNAILISPEQENFYCYRGILKYEMNDYEGALNDFNNSIKFWENFYLARSYRSTLRVKMEDYLGALEDFNFMNFSKEDENDPEKAWEFRYRGIAKFNTNDFTGACNDWQIAAKHNDSISLLKIKEYCK